MLNKSDISELAFTNSLYNQCTSYNQYRSGPNVSPFLVKGRRKRNVNVRWSGPFAFDESAADGVKSVSRAVETVEDVLIHYYMQPVPVYSFNRPFISETLNVSEQVNIMNNGMASISRSVRRIFKLHKGDPSREVVCARFHSDSVDYTIWIYGWGMNEKPVMNVMRYHHDTKILEFQTFEVMTIDGTDRMVNASELVLHAGMNRKDVEQYIRESHQECECPMYPEDICDIDLCLKMIWKNQDPETFDHIFGSGAIGTGIDGYTYSYNPVEMNIIRQAIAKRPDMIDSYIIRYHYHEIRDIWDQCPDAKLPSEIDHSYKSNMSRGSVFLDFSKREWNYVDRYMKSHSYMMGETPVDMLTYLTEPRYGNQFDYEWNGYKHHMMFIVDPEQQWLYTIIDRKACSDTVWSFTCVFTDIDRFVGIQNLAQYTSGVYVSNAQNLPISTEFVRDVLYPEDWIDVDKVIEHIMSMLAVQVVIAERPKRHRIVRESKRNPLANHSKKKKVDNEEYIIRRILMTERDAKEYVQKMSETPNTEREYTMESWHRIGHWRRTKNGSKVFIQPTTCHRRLELAQKEIHLKL